MPPSFLRPNYITKIRCTAKLLKIPPSPSRVLLPQRETVILYIVKDSRNRIVFHLLTVLRFANFHRGSLEDNF